MKKLTMKLWWYGINFLLRAIIFNLTIAFSITALVFKDDGMSKWAITAIALVSTWAFETLNVHFTWYKMKIQERGLYLAIRKHGKGVVHLTTDEVKAKLGQKTAYEFLTDTDVKIEMGMLINGTATFINMFIGIKWINAAIHFNKHEGTFDYVIDGYAKISKKKQQVKKKV